MYANEFLVGADPEFVMVGDGKKLVRMVKDEWETPVGTVGPDHGDAVAELRPKAARGTYRVVKHIQQLLKSENWREKQRAAKWLAGPAQEVESIDCECCCRQHCECDELDENGDTRTYSQPLGGHIHLGITADNPVWDSVEKALSVQYKYLEDLEVFPMDRVEARRAEGFGDYDEFTANHPQVGRYEKTYLENNRPGGYTLDQYHMEFRTPPSWLYHPRVAMLALTSAKLAAVDPEGTIATLQGPAHLNTLRSWYDRYITKDVNAKRVAENILAGKRSLRFDADANLQEVWKELDF